LHNGHDDHDDTIDPFAKYIDDLDPVNDQKRSDVEDVNYIIDEPIEPTFPKHRPHNHFEEIFN